MAYLERHAELKEDPRQLLPETMSLLALVLIIKLLILPKK